MMQYAESQTDPELFGAALEKLREMFGDNPEVPKVETMLPEPKSPYAITKLDGNVFKQRFGAKLHCNICGG